MQKIWRKMTIEVNRELKSFKGVGGLVSPGGWPEMWRQLMADQDPHKVLVEKKAMMVITFHHNPDMCLVACWSCFSFTGFLQRSTPSPTFWGQPGSISTRWEPTQWGRIWRNTRCRIRPHSIPPRPLPSSTPLALCSSTRWNNFLLILFCEGEHGSGGLRG